MNKKLTALACALVCVGASAYAAPAPAFHLDEVVVTAARVPQTVRETPTSVTVVTAQELQNRGAQNLGDALAAIPGITFTNDGMSRSHMSIRGTDSRHTLFMIDGKRVATDISKTLAAPGILESIGMENVERIEVVKGAASALYGSEAVGGVVNVILKKSAQPTFSGNVETGSYQSGEKNQYNYHFAYDSGTQNNLRYKVSYGARKKVPHYNDLEGTSYYYGTAKPFQVQLDYQFDPQHQVNFTYNRQVDQQYLLGGYEIKTVTMPVNGKPTKKEVKSKKADTNNRIVTQNISAEFHGEDHNWKYFTRLSRNIFDKNYYTHMGADYKTADYAKHVETTWEAQAGRQFDNHHVSVGAEYRQEEGRSTRMKTNHLVGEYQVGNLKAESIYKDDIKYQSLYLQDEWRPNDKWLVVPALRYDHSDRFGGRVSPKLGATYFVNENTRWKANIGTGYVTPGLMELNYNFLMFQNHFMGPRNGYVDFMWVGNPNLKPERSVNYDLSWEKDYADGNVKVSYFHNDIKDYIDSVQINENNDIVGTVQRGPMSFPKRLWKYQNQNLGRVHIDGVEISGEHHFNDMWSVHYGYTWLQAEDQKTKARLQDRPRHKFDLGVNYTHQHMGVYFWGNYYADYLDSLNDGQKKNFGVWNVLADYRFDNGLRVYAGVDNLFNSDTTARTYNGRFYKIGMDFKI